MIIPAPLYLTEAEAALEIFKDLPIVDMVGSPRIGECCKPWVFDFAASIFGAYDTIEGIQRIREFFLLVSKKNSKSTIAAGIMVTILVRNYRESGEFIIISPTIEIANNSFKPAADMCRRHPKLREMMLVQDHIRTITHRVTGATLKVIAADSETVGGKKAIVILIDELWLFGKKANAENILLEACGGLASRPEGFVIYLSTHSDEPPAGVFLEKLNYFRGVRDGKIIDSQCLPILYEWTQEELKTEAWRDPAQWHKTNPNLGASVSLDFLEREFKKSEIGGKEKLSKFCAKHLNVEIGISLQSDNWAGVEYWQQCSDQSITLESIIEQCETVDIGIDGGGLDDMLGLAVMGRKEDKWMLWTHAWIHPIALARRKSETSKYLDFAKEGSLTIVENMGDDLSDMAKIIVRLDEEQLLDMVGIDPSGAGVIRDALLEAGIDEKKIIGISQGWRMTGAIKTTERKLTDGGLTHSGQRMMAWCVGNAKIDPKGNAVTITKQSAGFAKIDPLMATFNAVELMSRNVNALSNYSKRGIVVL